jgi:sulfhydrogenase subunit alpha
LLCASRARTSEVELRIFEPPRFFEAAARPLADRGAGHHRSHLRHLPGRLPDERLHAMEDALGSSSIRSVRALRRLLYCGEWIESHVLHMVMLHAPDFLGVPTRSPGQAAPRAVKRGSASRRPATPSSPRWAAGRFTPSTCASAASTGRPREPSSSAPARARVGARRRDGAAPLGAGFSYPDFERDYELSSRCATPTSTRSTRDIVSSAGLDIDAATTTRTSRSSTSATRTRSTR